MHDRDDISKVDSDKFNSIINEVESLHQLDTCMKRRVRSHNTWFPSGYRSLETKTLLLNLKPREQVADAEALLDITNTLVSSVKAHSNEGITPSDFVSCLLRDFGKQVGPSGSTEDVRNSIAWKDIGLAVSHLDEAATEEKTDTDKNMAIMFDILKKNKRDGRVEINVNDKGWHILQGMPQLQMRLPQGRFDFQDWKLMVDSVGVGEELMPNRILDNIPSASQTDEIPGDTQGTGPPTTPIRKLSRNRGLVLQEQTVAEDSLKVMKQRELLPLGRESGSLGDVSARLILNLPWVLNFLHDISESLRQLEISDYALETSVVNSKN
ncbi:unnamed protein product [Thlaspi arvense]|uniref:Non-structural maintenance of chromosomes element 4 n=1 Tax=Thlaspi arvense TaxID=13288 RepID=A0AAU9RFU3_THLAR|nr:unnamed protein product [Thlaspi arvense]